MASRLERATQKYYENPNYCKFCGKQIEITTKPSYAAEKEFCNSSHAASYNNIGVRRHHNPLKICPSCGGKKFCTSALCHNCKKEANTNEKMKEPIKNFFLGDRHHPRFRYNEIRRWARILMHRWGVERKCIVCGYDKHTEVCHKKPIGTFDIDTSLGEVNCKENLTYLCPNHHWEFDKGLLKL